MASANNCSSGSSDNVHQLSGSDWFGQVRSQLAGVLSSPRFKGGDRSRRLLRYLVDECLQGRATGLKQFSIALDVFDRGPDFDPRVDPVVRTEAGKLRRALDDYYTSDGKYDAIRFELPKGGYAVIFHVCEQQETIGTAGCEETDLYRLPRIAVLPIENFGQELQSNVFAAGLTQGIIGALAKFQSLEVVGHHSFGQFRDTDFEIKQVAEDLDVDFFVGGALRWATDRFRLNVTLTDAATLTTIWSERHDRCWSAQDAFDLEDDIANDVAAKLATRYGIVAGTLSRSASARRNVTPASFDAALAFYAYHVDRSNFANARTKLQVAVRAEPDNAEVLAMLGEIEIDTVVLNLSQDGMELEAALGLCERAAQLDPNSQQVQQSLGYARMHCRKFDRAIQAFDGCIALNPNAACSRAVCGWAIALMGDWERGLAHLAAARRLNPRQPGWLNLAPLLYAWSNGENDEAYRLAQTMLTPGIPWGAVVQAAAAAKIDRNSEAAATVDELKLDFPGIARYAEELIGRFVYDEQRAKEILDALHRAGL